MLFANKTSAHLATPIVLHYTIATTTWSTTTTKHIYYLHSKQGTKYFSTGYINKTKNISNKLIYYITRK